MACGPFTRVCGYCLWTNGLPDLTGTARYDKLYRFIIYCQDLCPTGKVYGTLVLCLFGSDYLYLFWITVSLVCKYQDNNLCTTPSCCTHEVAPLNIRQLSMWSCQNLHSALCLRSPKSFIYLWSWTDPCNLKAQAPLFRNYTQTAEPKVALSANFSLALWTRKTSLLTF